MMSGAAETAVAFEKALAKAGMLAGDARQAKATKDGVSVILSQSGCQGLCEQGPLVTIEPEGVLYVQVDPEKAERIVAEHLAGGTAVADFFYGGEASPGAAVTPGEAGGPMATPSAIPFFARQNKIVLRRCGKVDPEDIDDCISAGAYRGIAKVLGAAWPPDGVALREGVQPLEAGEPMAPEQVIEEVLASGLRGRGGAGFPTGMKWKLCRQEPGDKKYAICNGDEGDPGAFMDGATMEGDPHSVIEGMLIGSYAMGADEGYIYVRAEYPLAVRRLNIALEQAVERGILGPDVLGVLAAGEQKGAASAGAGFSFDLHIKEGAGAFVCGEETALMNSVEGKRGMPRVRPPFPAQYGLWGKPSNINNVETWAAVEWIITHGAGAYSALGSEDSHGTKVFSVTGKVKHTGLVEVPMGTTTVRQVIYDVAGGIRAGRNFRAVQMGGPSGGCLPADKLDLPIEYKSITESGAIIGSGGMVVVDETSCMVDLAKYFLTFTQSESCGKCVPCRIGTKRMLEILTRITAGEGRDSDLDELKTLALDVKRASLCGLGQTAPNPLLTTLRYFEEEYLEHVRDKHCRAGACAALIELFIDPMVCTKCKACIKVCPVDCIAFDGDILTIEQEKCIKCRSCVASCRFDAITPRRGTGGSEPD
jgi:NADH:ubiquinone oxidoreductase subunit F (NADH-binding)/(2Fe-2S) ferredoxin/NAD-dependent dihydropyrimidine dehydrogenase PreA subunit